MTYHIAQGLLSLAAVDRGEHRQPLLARAASPRGGTVRSARASWARPRRSRAAHRGPTPGPCGSARGRCRRASASGRADGSCRPRQPSAPSRSRHRASCCSDRAVPGLPVRPDTSRKRHGSPGPPRPAATDSRSRSSPPPAEGPAEGLPPRRAAASAAANLPRPTGPAILDRCRPAPRSGTWTVIQNWRLWWAGTPATHVPPPKPPWSPLGGKSVRSSRSSKSGNLSE